MVVETGSAVEDVAQEIVVPSTSRNNAQRPPKKSKTKPKSKKGM